MDVIQKKLIKTSKGWYVEFLISLNEIGFFKINSKDKNNLSKYFKAYNVCFDDNDMHLSRSFVRMEPWEDETPEEMVKSISEEIKSSLNKLIEND